MDLCTGVFCLAILLPDRTTDPVERRQGENPYPICGNIVGYTVRIPSVDVDVIARPVGCGGGDGAGTGAVQREDVIVSSGGLCVPP